MKDVDQRVTQCPVCTADIDQLELDRYTFDSMADENVVVARCRCHVCNSVWKDHYSFNGTREILETSEEGSH